jgi:hypothetical protein
MNRQTGRYDLNHADIIARLVMDATLPRDVIAGRVMLHAQALERERDAALARADELDAQLTHVIEG